MRLGWVLCLLVVGCGPSSFDDFRAQLSKAACNRAVKCGFTAASRVDFCAPPTDALAIAAPGPLDPDAAIKAGRMSFFSSGAQDCIDAVASAPCDPGVLAERIALHCHHVLDPAVETGKACDGPGECVGGECVQPTPSCPGTCVAFPPPGAPCDPAGATVQVTCDPTVQYCGEVPPDGGVDAGADGGTDGGTFVCMRQKPHGATCAHDDECQFGLVCVGTCSDPPRAHEGEACAAAGTLCDDGVYCAPTGTCTRVHHSGEPCDAPLACDRGLACIGLDPSQMSPAGTCQPWLDAGQACAGMPPVVTGCPADLTCNATCAVSGMPLPGFHAPCASGACAFGLYCDGSLCQFQVGQGGDCSLSPNACRPDAPPCDPTTHTCTVPASCG